jgi:anti-anti-sigma regulatory factor
LVDVASPIIVDGKLLGSVFTGQFLYEPPDIERFRRQAQQFGFDEEAYLEALSRVPIIPREQVKPILHYLSLFTNMLTDIGAQQLRQYELEHEHIALQEQVIDAQRSAIRELSTPLIPLSDTVVLMPLVGSIDSQRAQMIMDVLLEGIAEHQARIAIMDITGVQVVDTQVANALIQAAHAVKLLGAETILTGIGPTMAQTLVHLGIDLSTLITKGSLQAGIAQALNGMKK